MGPGLAVPWASPAPVILLGASNARDHSNSLASLQPRKPTTFTATWFRGPTAVTTCGPLHILENVKQEIKFLMPPYSTLRSSLPLYQFCFTATSGLFSSSLFPHTEQPPGTLLLPALHGPHPTICTPGFLLPAAQWLSTAGELVTNTRDRLPISSLPFLTDLVSLMPGQGTSTYLFLRVLKCHTVCLQDRESPVRSADQTRTWKQTCSHHSQLLSDGKCSEPAAQEWKPGPDPLLSL